MDDHQNIPGEINDYIISFLSGKLAPEDALKLVKWLDEDQENKKFFDQFAHLWHISSALDNTEEFDADIAWEDVTKYLERRNMPVFAKERNIWAGPFLKIASIIVFVLLSGLFFKTYFKKEADNKQVEMIAPLGAKSVVVLADGSKVWLNSGSKIIFFNSFGKTSRNIELEGEAYFSVAKNKKLPFIVHASDLTITAVGTAFNVKAYPEENTVETTLEEGVVKIEPTRKLDDFGAPLFLKPNQSAVYYKKVQSLTHNTANTQSITQSKSNTGTLLQSERIKVGPLDDTRPQTSWKEKRWLFRHETLENLVRKLERRYDIKVTFADDASKNYTFSGSLYDESIEQVFAAIKLVAPINFKMEHKNIEISTNKYLKDKYEKIQK